MKIMQQSTFRGDLAEPAMLDRLLTPVLLSRINEVIGDYRDYLAGLPETVRPLLKEMAPVQQGGQSREEQEESAEGRPISPGKLSVLALPFWLGEVLGIEEQVCRRFSLANIFGLSHFIALDKLVDGDVGARSPGPEDSIPSESSVPFVAIAGSLYQQQLAARYQEFFPPDSPFWRLMEKYWLEWASSMVWERSPAASGAGGLAFSRENQLNSARKAAPLKICTSGMALLGGRPDLIPDLEAAVDGMHAVMQMMDDLVDMGQDLAANLEAAERVVTAERFNNALNMVGAGAGTQALGPYDRRLEAIGRHLFTSGQDEAYLAEMQRVAEQTQALLGRHGLVDWADLIGISVRQAQEWRDRHVAWLVEAFGRREAAGDAGGAVRHHQVELMADR